MIPGSFEYKKAESVREALQLLKEDHKLLAGGHSLIPAMKLRLNMPEVLIDISKIPSLREIRDNDKNISIGSAVTHGEIASHEAIRRHIPMVTEAAGMIGDIQVRNKGTIGGSIAHADPSADWPAVLLAANATVIIANSESSREVDIDQFFQGFYSTVLGEDELITQVRIPKSRSNANSCYEKFVQPASRFAIVGCAVAASSDGVRVAFTGVSDTPFRDKNVENALNGKSLTMESIEEAAAHAAEDVDIMSDHFAGEKYRKHLAKVYAKRALQRLV